MSDLKVGDFIGAINEQWLSRPPHRYPLVITSIGKTVCAETVPSREGADIIRRRLVAGRDFMVKFPDHETGAARCDKARAIHQQYQEQIETLTRERDIAVRAALKGE